MMLILVGYHQHSHRYSHHMYICTRQEEWKKGFEEEERNGGREGKWERGRVGGREGGREGGRKGRKGRCGKVMHKEW